MTGINAVWLGASKVSAALAITRRVVVIVALAATFVAVAVPDVAAQDAQSKVEQGLVAYLGILPAALVKGHDPEHSESTMHGGSTSGQHEYHILVAVFEESTGLRVSNADVFATIAGLGHVGGMRVQLEPMKIADTTTYGNFVTFPGADLYTITVLVRRSEASHPVAFEFSYDHLAR